MMKKNKTQTKLKELPKTPTGIKGLDEVTNGGLPKGRPSLVCGNAGCGKTILSMEFIVRGATEFGEPGVFMAFEESEKELVTNVASLGFDLDKLVEQKKIVLDHVRIERSEIEETGEYDLEGLFIRLNHAIETIGAKRVVLDTIESLFGGLNDLILRSELRRLFRWLKEKGVTALITAERGEDTLTRQGMEEYVSDCVILLDHRVTEQTSTRRMRIVKYRGSLHGTNEYPFLIDETGFSVFPITSVGLYHEVSSSRISSGVPQIDKMLDNQGYFRGSSILVSGTAGTGKSSLAAHFSASSCARQERVMYFALEESPHQIMRNMCSIGIDLESCVKKGFLRFHSNRPTFYGLEAYLTAMHKEVTNFKPHAVIIDPISSFIVGANRLEAKSMIMRFIDYLKLNQITAFLTSLTPGGTDLEHTDIHISSLIDTWLLLRENETGTQRKRRICILKSRGMAHSSRIFEFKLTNHGVELLPGAANMAIDAKEKSDHIPGKRVIKRRTQ